MKMVIDIPDDDYMVLEKWFSLENLNSTLEQRLFCAVANGAVLPKGHGRLVDENHVITELVYRKNLLADNVTCGQVTEIFDSAVVIEADEVD